MRRWSFMTEKNVWWPKHAKHGMRSMFFGLSPCEACLSRAWISRISIWACSLKIPSTGLCMMLFSNVLLTASICFWRSITASPKLVESREVYSPYLSPPKVIWYVLFSLITAVLSFTNAIWIPNSTKSCGSRSWSRASWSSIGCGVWLVRSKTSNRFLIVTCNEFSILCLVSWSKVLF